jgi:hypothetical protein
MNHASFASRTFGLFVVLPTALAAFAFLGCSSDSDGNGKNAPACTEYTVPAGTDLTAPAVSFKDDVLPAFRQSCVFSSCHGPGLAPSFGPKQGDADTKAIVEGMVGKPSAELTSMNLVTAGDPKQSWLMRKLDGDFCLFKSQCEGGDCGELMPAGGDRLDVQTRDTVRRWIAQGAKDN